MANEIKCVACHYYDPMLGSNGKDTKKGWCVKRSKYPHKEGPGQVFPPNVERVAAGELAKPFLVRGGSVIEACPFVRESHDDPVARKRGLQVDAGKK